MGKHRKYFGFQVCMIINGILNGMILSGTHCIEEKCSPTCLDHKYYTLRTGLEAQPHQHLSRAQSLLPQKYLSLYRKHQRMCLFNENILHIWLFSRL